MRFRQWGFRMVWFVLLPALSVWFLRGVFHSQPWGVARSEAACDLNHQRPTVRRSWRGLSTPEDVARGAASGVEVTMA